ncbi:hypothetical protein [Macrococcus capreoli]|uniref:hypothetical protein n=1 Tax=Macrococcus capreoli TaxID=2982690 RepID=UPI003EE72B6D
MSIYNHLSDNGIFIFSVFNTGNIDVNWADYPEELDWEYIDSENDQIIRATNEKISIDIESQIIFLN